MFGYFLKDVLGKVNIRYFMVEMCVPNFQEVTVMSRTCEICGKKPTSGNNVSHAHNKTRKVWYPNLQKVKALDKGTVRTMKVCTRCIRSGKIVKAA